MVEEETLPIQTVISSHKSSCKTRAQRGNLYGHGAIDNKGPVLAWINAVETFKALKLVDSLVGDTGHIQIPGIYDSVASLTEEESKLYEPIQFNLEEHKRRNTPAPVALPSLSIHGFEGAFNEPGIKTVIAAKVIGKSSIRQVPHMDLSVVEQQVKNMLSFADGD
ncbi:hypothetical protein AAES_25075 [Amazona aestiva]|uniref:Uncharacterized protein n=1 Tax=Amazona aestiva TaxID=12930 RepID=A0A0Q3TRP9_AMAAE|nr:hypothetical protein AAES_25075 [Amazona aestiva]